MLNVEGGASRLAELITAPTVAIVGSSRASDYGVEMAKSLARGLAASGVTVAGGLRDGIEVAAHAGALEVNGATVAVLPGGLDTGPPAKRRSLYERLRNRGCAVAELPRGSEARRWGQVASQRIVVRLAQLVVVVEAREHPGDLAGARIARALGRPLAAIPGRVTSPASSGTNALLLNGAHLVRGPGGRAGAALRSGGTARIRRRRSTAGARCDAASHPGEGGRGTRHAGEAHARGGRLRRDPARPERARADGDARARRRRQICATTRLPAPSGPFSTFLTV